MSGVRTFASGKLRGGTTCVSSRTGPSARAVQPVEHAAVLHGAQHLDRRTGSASSFARRLGDRVRDPSNDLRPSGVSMPPRGT